VAHVLVTGGGGFIGSHLVDHLLVSGYTVRVLDNFSTGRRSNLRHVQAEIKLIEGDLRDAEVVARAARGVELIFHQGALPSVPRSISDPRTSNAVNVDGTLNVLLAARDAGVRRVVVASSSSVYGDTPALPKVETMPTQPRSPYAISKLATEQYTSVFASIYGMETVALRYFNVFGPRQDPGSQYSGVIARYCTAALCGQPYPVHGDGQQSRDFTYIENVVRANMLAAQAPDVAGQVFNVACGVRITLLEMIAALNRLIGRELPATHQPARSGDVRHSLADTSKAQQMLGYTPLVAFEEGLAYTLEWYRTHADEQ
jgi:UDP-glucose 4-epimerase